MNILELFKPIKTFVFDVDGVLATDLMLIEPNTMARSMNSKDGYALQLAIKKGYRVAIISGGKSAPVMERLIGLGILDVYLGETNKSGRLQQYVAQHNLKWNEILYMGDDIPDHAPMLLVGLPCCPADAVNEVKSISRYISPLFGGKGCGRDVIEKVLKLNGHWSHEETVASK